mgnify:CR=1 FL=1
MLFRSLAAVRRGAQVLAGWPQAFEAALDAADAPRARHLAHELKGLCSMMGEYTLAADAGALEKPLLAGSAPADDCMDLVVRTAALARQLARALDAMAT